MFVIKVLSGNQGLQLIWIFMVRICYTRTDGRFEFMKPLVVFRVEAILFDKFPESFNQIQVR